MSKENPPQPGRKVTVHNPYLWKATLRSGAVLVRGDPFQGEPVLSPMKLPKDQLMKLELLPSLENDQWPRMEATATEGETIEYAMTRESDVTAGAQNHDGADPSLIRTVAVRLGVRRADGSLRTLQWSLPGSQYLPQHLGTYEDIVNGKTST